MRCDVNTLGDPVPGEDGKHCQCLVSRGRRLDCTACDSRVRCEAGKGSREGQVLWEAVEPFCSQAWEDAAAADPSLHAGPRRIPLSSLQKLLQSRVDPRFVGNYDKLVGKDGWFDRAFVNYFAGAPGSKHANMTEQLIRSVHMFSAQPIVVVHLGSRTPDSWTAERFPRLLLFHAAPMGPDTHRSFNFNKLRSFLMARARTGVELDSDQFVGPGVDYMFEMTEKEITKESPLPVLPVHFYSFTEADTPQNLWWRRYCPDPPACTAHTMRWSHAHPTWTFWSLPFVGRWLRRHFRDEHLPQMVSSKAVLLADLAVAEIPEDEDLLNVGTWEEKGTKQWCKFDNDYHEFADMLSWQPENGDHTTTGDIASDPKFYPQGAAKAFFTAHNCKDPAATAKMLDEIEERWKKGLYPTSTITYKGRFFESGRNGPALMLIGAVGLVCVAVAALGRKVTLQAERAAERERRRQEEMGQGAKGSGRGSPPFAGRSQATRDGLCAFDLKSPRSCAGLAGADVACCAGAWRWLSAALRWVLAPWQAVITRPLMQNMQNMVVVIAGPTAVGKSDTAVALAAQLQKNGRKVRLISADSVQVYKGLDIGSNKPSSSEQEQWPIQLVDWLEPDRPCTAGSWTQAALSQVDEALGLNETPIVVGGSMYLDWLVNGEPDAAKSDPDVQARIAEELRPFQERMDWDGAIAILATVDAGKAQRINRNNWRHLSRQLEVVRSAPRRAGRASRTSYDLRAFFLSPIDRQALFHRIDPWRCKAMLHKGLLEEVAALLEQGLQLDTPAADAIGYRQVLDYLTRPNPLDGDAESFLTFLQRFAAVSRNYAKSQVQWFMKDSSFMWLDANPTNPEALGAELSHLCSLRKAKFLSQVRKDTAVRETQATQAASMGNFACALGDLPKEELHQLLERADRCTHRVPPPARQQLPALPGWSVGQVRMGKVYWHGRHQKWGWGNPLGKLHRQGLQLLSTNGWQAIKESDASTLPAFCWPTRQSSFPAHAATDELPLIRPFPQEFTRKLDNKASLAAHLTAAGCDIHPMTWDAQEFLRAPPEEGPEGPEETFFLKHSLGVKGNAVHVFDRTALDARLAELGLRCESFIVQRCVAPLSLRNGRKWVMRAHALLHAMNGTVRLYSHRDVISLEYGQPYTSRLDLRAAHVSNSAKLKHLPKPELVKDELVLQQVQQLTRQAFASVAEWIPLGPYAPEEAELCQVFGLDIILDAHGKAWLLEVNDYPAIASGTMEHVDTKVYTDLVRDVLLLVVLPKVDSTTPSPGGWQLIELDEGTASKRAKRRMRACAAVTV
ncbi:unnamed protein product [Effrenium voratum]|uniref:tRNA dimethylallyltransferase n=1 Tax=Effrenium voratum TaxID=2562239 RepID=A0AA36INS6_9DINO|nr:unnamed protein product [Effrenium voratum]